MVDEQGQIQKELTRLQNIKKLTEEQSKSKQDIEKLEKEVTACTQQLAEQDAVVKALQRLYENARMALLIAQAALYAIGLIQLRIDRTVVG